MLPARLTCLLSAVMASLALTSPPVRAQSPEHQEARQSLQAERWQEAAEILVGVVRAEPDNGIAWFELGMALHADGRPSEAIDPYLEALRLGAQPASARWRVARAYALVGQVDRALAHLDTMAQLGFASPGALTGQADFEALGGNERFDAIVAEMQANSTPCVNDPKAREFDFWAGDWDVFNRAGAQLGTNRVEIILGECVLLENWTDSQGRGGKSFNFYDSSTPGGPRWRQLWVADNGSVLDYEQGEFRDGAMRFDGQTVDAEGDIILQRLVFTPVHADTVHQEFFTSTDNGVTFVPGFFGIYVRSDRDQPERKDP